MIKSIEIESLEELSHFQKSAFSALCCERLLPNYKAFSIIENLNNNRLLEDMVRYIWTTIFSKNVNEIEIQERIEACQAIIPNEDQYETILKGLASRAVIAVILTLQSLLSDDAQLALRVSRFSINSIDEYLHFVNAPRVDVYAFAEEFEDWILKSPMMVDELEKQKEFINRLSNLNIIKEADVDSLKALAKKTGVLPFDRGFVTV